MKDNKHLKKVIRKQKHKLHHHHHHHHTENKQSLIFDQETGHSYFQSFTSTTSYKEISTVIAKNSNSNSDGHLLSCSKPSQIKAKSVENKELTETIGENVYSSDSNLVHTHRSSYDDIKQLDFDDDMLVVVGGENEVNTSPSVQMSMRATNHDMDDCFSDRMLGDDEIEHELEVIIEDVKLEQPNVKKCVCVLMFDFMFDNLCVVC